MSVLKHDLQNGPSISVLLKTTYENVRTISLAGETKSQQRNPLHSVHSTIQ